MSLRINRLILCARVSWLDLLKWILSRPWIWGVLSFTCSRQSKICTCLPNLYLYSLKYLMAMSSKISDDTCASIDPICMRDSSGQVFEYSQSQIFRYTISFRVPRLAISFMLNLAKSFIAFSIKSSLNLIKPDRQFFILTSGLSYRILVR